MRRGRVPARLLGRVSRRLQRLHDETLRAFGEGEAVFMTYGAQPNTKLLQDYGFTTLPNIEPDGSSNDVVVLELPTDGDRPEALPAAPDVQNTSFGRR